jgi:tetratricopeptide (TPR) repeat protein
MIPSTIQDVIMAKVDSLPDGAKEVLQTGSVIEREFSYEIIKWLMVFPEKELLAHLSILKDSELLYERGIFPQSVYVFKHALTQEVTYKSLLSKKRREIHKKIGEAIESLFADRLEEFYEMLAHHYFMAEKTDKAIEYWQLAGRKALKLYAVTEAIDYFTKAMQNIEELPEGETKRDLRLEVGTKLGFTFLLRNMYPKARETVRSLEKLAAEKKHLRSLGRIYTTIGIYLAIYELDGKNGIEYLQKSIELSKQTNDIPALSFGNTYLAWSYCLFGDLESAEMRNSQLIPTLERRQSWYTLSVPYYILCCVYCDKADAANAEQWSQKSFKCTEKSDDPLPQSWGNLAVGRFYLEQGNFEAAQKKLTEALDYSRHISLHVAMEDCLSCLIQVHLKRGEHDDSLRYIHQLHDLIEQEGGPLVYLAPCFGLEAKLYLKMRKWDKALECLKTALEYEVPYWEGFLSRTFGDYYLEVGSNNFKSSQEWYQKAIQVHERIGMRLELGRDYFSLGMMLKRQEAFGDASEYFDKALNTFQTFGATWDIRQVKKAMQGL